MGHKRKKLQSKMGLAPGTLLFVGEQKMAQVDISLLFYSEDFWEEKKVNTIQETIQLIDKFQGVVWVNIDGVHDEQIIETICTYLGVHKLSMEDILSMRQRPKIEEYDSYIHLVLKMLMVDFKDNTIDQEQLSFIFKNNILVTFQEKTGDVFDGVRKRIKDPKSLIRKHATDYLLYALIDSVVDHYFLILETLSERLDDLEITLLEHPDKNTLNQLHVFRREMLTIRRSIYPLREVISRFEKLNDSIISADTKIFVRDLYDHTIQAIETTEVLRDMASGLLDLYMNSLSNKMNEIMKILTIMTSIFIPLSFIAGVYGMNFDHMPELHYQNGYYWVWGTMIILIILMLYYFKKKEWI